MADTMISDWFSPTLFRERCTLVDLPDGRALTLCLAEPAGDPPPSGWPCLILLDGERFFHSFAGAADTLAVRPAKTRVDAMVIVGIGHRDQDGPTSAQRITDFTSTPCAEGEVGNSFAQGAAPQFRDVLLERILPIIAANSQINQGEISLFGHSLAGLFVLETLAMMPTRFAHWISISPSLWWHTPSPTIAQQSLLLGCGELEIRRDMRSRIEQWAASVPDDQACRYYMAARADHGSAPFALIPDALRWACGRE